MSERKGEQWLDEQLQWAVDGAKPVFDVEAWKQKHRAEYDVLLARLGAAKPPVTGIGRLIRVVGSPSFPWFAVAAALIVAVGLFLQPLERQPQGPVVPPPVVNGAPVKMPSMMSLRSAYQRGGFEALDQQLQATLDTFGPRPLHVSRQELSESVKGS